ncbi:MAG: transglutaminase family protein [Pseudomonadales bacterium]|nr:transglutaminase family protein [Pseudomonadales bacterium]MCP5185461.1 transglutaminase family protein [Pseudomonadales bacterium]
MITDIDPAWLAPTGYLDFDDPAVQAFADQATDGLAEPVAIAKALFLAVRDGFRYDPYQSTRDAAGYRASQVVKSTSNWCIPKSVLFAAVARYKGIPARLGFADVRNHLTSEKLSKSMGTDVFAWHGYAELLLGGRWVKLSTAFNIELCRKFGVKVLEFDGIHDALMHPYDENGNRHMEYLLQRGSFDDLPLAQIFATFDEVYGGSGVGSDAERDTAFDA